MNHTVNIPVLLTITLNEPCKADALGTAKALLKKRCQAVVFVGEDSRLSGIVRFDAAPDRAARTKVSIKSRKSIPSMPPRK